MSRALKRLLAIHPREQSSEIFSRIEPPADLLRQLLKGITADQIPADQVIADLKTQIANLTGHLSKADI
jgi:hypothetical protein